MKITDEELVRRAEGHLSDIYFELYGHVGGLGPSIRSRQVLALARAVAEILRELPDAETEAKNRADSQLRREGYYTRLR